MKSNDRSSSAARQRDSDRVGAALNFLYRNRRRPVSLTEAASAVGLSEYHFQRLFTRWAGVSPKRFAQFLTLGDARALLRNSASLLSASHELGLSGSSRLHDLFVTIDAVTPGEYKSGGAELTIDVGEHQCPFGVCLIGVTPRGVCWLSFADERGDPNSHTQLRQTWPAAKLRDNPGTTASVMSRIFKPHGSRRSQPFRVLVGGTNFQLKVWEALLRIPPGQLVSYQDIATAIGRPSAARAVGNAVGANAVSYLIPCHRVIRRMAMMSNYRWGPERKQALITWEALRRQTATTAMAPAGREQAKQPGS